MKRNLIVLLVAFTLVLNFSGCAQKAGQESPAAPVQQASGTVKLEDLKLAIGSAPGPVTYPLARMAEQNSNIILKPWQGGEQLTAMITTKEVQLCSTPLNNAVLSYNKGLDTQLLMVTVWGMLYVMSTESDVKSLQDLKGKEVALSGKGGIHDLIFRHLLIKNGINPDSDLTLSYLDMSEASSRLAAGQLKYAVLNEPQSSIATLNAQKSGVQLHRVLDLTQEWNELPGQENARMPMAGIIVVNGSGITSEQAAGFAKAYIDTAEWVNKHSAFGYVYIKLDSNIILFTLYQLSWNIKLLNLTIFTKIFERNKLTICYFNKVVNMFKITHKLYFNKASAICTAFKAAPFLKLSQHTHIFRLFLAESSFLILETNTSSLSTTSIGVAY